jgi:hypothetical protein
LPVSRVPLDYSRGQIQLPRVHFANEDLVDALERDDIDTVTGFGYRSPEDILLPETVSGPDAHGFSSKWIGVRVEFPTGWYWVPVLKEDLPVVELDREFIDGREDGSGSTRVGHCKADPTDVYIGRGPDGANFLDFLDGELEAGDRGWLGNPYHEDEFGREQCVSMFLDVFDHALERYPELRREIVERCRGKRLGGWCQRLDDDDPTCHGEVIAAYVDHVLVASNGGESA